MIVDISIQDEEHSANSVMSAYFPLMESLFRTPQLPLSFIPFDGVRSTFLQINVLSIISLVPFGCIRVFRASNSLKTPVLLCVAFKGLQTVVLCWCSAIRVLPHLNKTHSQMRKSAIIFSSGLPHLSKKMKLLAASYIMKLPQQ